MCIMFMFMFMFMFMLMFMFMFMLMFMFMFMCSCACACAGRVHARSVHVTCMACVGRVHAVYRPCACYVLFCNAVRASSIESCVSCSRLDIC